MILKVGPRVYLNTEYVCSFWPYKGEGHADWSVIDLITYYLNVYIMSHQLRKVLVLTHETQNRTSESEPVISNKLMKLQTEQER